METKNLDEQTSVSRCKNFDTRGALEILRHFYIEARKEIKKNDSTIVSLNADDEVCNLNFIGDHLILSLMFQEGGAK